MQADAIYNQRGKSLEFIEEPYCAGAPVTGGFSFPGCRGTKVAVARAVAAAITISEGFELNWGDLGTVIGRGLGISIVQGGSAKHASFYLYFQDTLQQLHFEHLSCRVFSIV